MLGPAFYGETHGVAGVIDSRNPVADRRIAAPEPMFAPQAGGVSSARAFRVLWPSATLASAGNRRRRGIVGVLHEFWRGSRRTMMDAGYPYFVAGREGRYDRVTTNRLARPRRLYKVVPNRQGIYRAPQYGPAGDTQVIQTTPGG